MNSFRRLLVVTLVITLEGCSPYPDTIPSRSNEENFGPTNVQYGTFREGLAVVVWNDLAFPAEHGSVGSSIGISANARKRFSPKGTRPLQLAWRSPRSCVGSVSLSAGSNTSNSYVSRQGGKRSRCWASLRPFCYGCGASPRWWLSGPIGYCRAGETFSKHRVPALA